MVIPTLNSWKTLPNLIDSLQSQKYKNWRVLFVDGESNQSHKNFLQELNNHDSRFNIINETKKDKGIYGAMNDGFLYAEDYEWIFFIGSDDFLASPNVLFEINNSIKKINLDLDLFICKSAYLYEKQRNIKRISSFFNTKKNLVFFDSKKYRKLLFLGFTPPHQSTFFSPKLRKLINEYNTNFQLAADLDYFLNLKKFNHLKIAVFDFLSVKMSDQGISGKLTRKRLCEVFLAYRKAYGFLWILPFTLRYINRIKSKLKFI